MTARNNASDRAWDGFTLIETMMVIVILGILGTGILMYFVSIGSSADPVLATQGTALASVNSWQASNQTRSFFSIVISNENTAFNNSFRLPKTVPNNLLIPDNAALLAETNPAQ